MPFRGVAPDGSDWFETSECVDHDHHAAPETETPVHEVQAMYARNPRDGGARVQLAIRSLAHRSAARLDAIRGSGQLARS